MSKTITMRVDDTVYAMIKTAAAGSRRTISNFLEYAAIAYLSQEAYVSDQEMSDIMSDKALLKSLRQGTKEIKEGKYRIVP